MWYVQYQGFLDNGEQEGPCDDEQLLALAKLGKLTPDALVNHKVNTKARWFSAKQLPALKKIFEQLKLEKEENKQAAKQQKAELAAKKRELAIKTKEDQIKPLDQKSAAPLQDAPSESVTEKKTRITVENPPTTRQLDYAKSLGIAIPENVDKFDLSDLISRRVDEDQPSVQKDWDLARFFDIVFTQYIGRIALYNRIQEELSVPGRERELLSWFSFNVYRDLLGGEQNIPSNGLSNHLVKAVASKLIEDNQVLKSVRRYRGSELLIFGEYTLPKGYTCEGGSRRTIGYETVATILKEKGNISLKRRGTRRSGSTEIQQNVVVQQAASQQAIVVNYVRQKSAIVAFLLTLFFGPFGMFYSTVIGALVCMGLAFVVLPLISMVTAGFGLILYIPFWLLMLVWAIVACK